LRVEQSPTYCSDNLSDMDTLALLQGIRFVDSFFPSGGYAYSSGLEATVQGGAVKDSSQLARYVGDLLRGGISRREAVAVAVAHKASMAGKVQPALAIDAELDSMKMGRESRLASRQMGRQVIRVAAEEFEGDAVLRQFHAKVEEGHTPGHLPVCIGLTLAACGWTRQETVVAYLYHTAVGFVSAAMKLLPIGQREGQRLLAEWSPLLTELSRHAVSRSVMVSWSPVQDIYAMRHATLESRLFRS
jgi:urease accessory protein